MNIEKLPFKEWYLLADEQAAVAREMVKVAKAIEELPEDTPDHIKEDISYFMQVFVDEGGSYPDLTVSSLWDQIEKARGANNAKS